MKTGLWCFGPIFLTLVAEKKSENPGFWKVPNFDGGSHPKNSAVRSIRLIPEIWALNGLGVKTGFCCFGPIFHNFGGNKKSEKPGFRNFYISTESRIFRTVLWSGPSVCQPESENLGPEWVWSANRILPF